MGGYFRACLREQGKKSSVSAETESTSETTIVHAIAL
jgi:hypothetical protein